MPRAELILEPETEHAGDLFYAEHSSCRRSIHILLREADPVQRRFVLAVYRDIVRRYLSVSDLEPPLTFLSRIREHIESLASAHGLDVEQGSASAFFLMFVSTNEHFLLTTRPELVHVVRDGALTSLSELPGVERLRVDSGGVQEELFPQRLRDSLLLLRWNDVDLAGVDLVMGSSPNELPAVTETLGDPALNWDGEGAQRLRTRVARRILVVRLPGPARPVELSTSRNFRRFPRWAYGTALGVVAAAAAVWWLSGWTSRGGTDRTGRSALDVDAVATDAPTNEAERAPQFRLAWRESHAKGVTSSPLLTGDLVIYGARDSVLYARDRSSGSVAWRARCADGVGASPALAVDRVVIADYEGEVRAVDVRDGRMLWRRALGARVTSSPVVTGERVVLGAYDGVVYCLSTRDGELLWRVKTGSRIRGSCAASDDLVVAPSYDGYLYAIGAEDGDVRWRKRLGGQLSASPAIEGELVAMGTPEGRVVGLSAADGSERWAFEADAAVKSGLNTFSGRLFFGSNDRHVYCLNLADGSLIWRYVTGDIVLSRPAIHRDLVFVSSYDGSLYALGMRDGRLVDRFTAGEPMYSSPVVDEASVYVGTNEGSFMRITHRDPDAS